MDWESAIAREFIRGPYSPTPYATGAFLLLLIGIFAFFAVRTFESYGMFSLGIHAFELLVIAVCLVLWARFETRVELPKVDSSVKATQQTTAPDRDKALAGER